jgi:hypothetical protein
MMTKGRILILLPSLNRPKQLSECVTSLCATATGPFDFLALTEKSTFVEAVNSVPEELLYRYDILGLLGDDCRMRTQDWDGLVQNHLAGKVGLVYGRDGIQDEKLPTQPFFSTAIALTLGFVLPPMFKQYFTDDWLLALANGAGCRFYAPDLFTEHMHSCAGKSANDETYMRSNAWMEEDGEAWHRYRAQGLLDKDIRAVKELRELMKI